MERSRRTAFSHEGDNRSNDANGSSDKRVGERNVATPILSRGKKKNKGPVKPVFHRAFVVWGREVLSGGLKQMKQAAVRTRQTVVRAEEYCALLSWWSSFIVCASAQILLCYR